MAQIMIIDDDVDLAETISGILTRAGHDVRAMHTTDGAVEALTANTPDLLLLDVMFPDNPAAGFDLARAVRAAKPIEHLPIILLTSVNEEFTMNFSAEDIDTDWLPVQHFVEKPVSPADLLGKIEATLGQSA